ncbi:DsrE family protein [Desulfocurvus sp.]|jgi:predicted peroxiredoxin|uniref:DsrE family protein n=1 Tax=Desulfocurvus sp. TaxID=2871698 RepID=UPI0025C1B298|nr:DsrE family protein [Desulfocurvus sp.]MCK9239352.1 DsrE family protein [Desulfocurvus sp.]
MKRLVRAACAALLLALLLALPARAGAPARVMTSVTTADVNRAAMAIQFTHAAMKSKGLPATLFFNVDGVRLVHRGVPSPVYPSGQSIRDMLAAFMRDGGTVLACPMCMKHVGGMTEADLMDGVAARAGAGLDAALAPDTLVLTY